MHCDTLFLVTKLYPLLRQYWGLLTRSSPLDFSYTVVLLLSHACIAHQHTAQFSTQLFLLAMPRLSSLLQYTFLNQLFYWCSKRCWNDIFFKTSCLFKNLLIVQVSETFELNELFDKHSLQPRRLCTTGDCFTHCRVFTTAHLSLLDSFNQLNTRICAK